MTENFSAIRDRFMRNSENVKPTIPIEHREELAKPIDDERRALLCGLVDYGKKLEKKLRGV